MIGRLTDDKFIQVELCVQEILSLLGYTEEEHKNHFGSTPKRYATWFAGLAYESPEEMEAQVFELLKVQFDHDDDDAPKDLVIVKDINFASLCAHHLLPFYGKASIAYLPVQGRIVGLSKLARLVKYVAKRPTVQEVVTKEVADYIVRFLSPHCMVVLEGVHECMRIRGVEDPSSTMVTSAVRGHFASDDSNIKNEVLKLLGGK